MDFTLRPSESLQAVLYDLVMGPMHAKVIEMDGDMALLRMADQSQAMLLVREPLDATQGR